MSAYRGRNKTPKSQVPRKLLPERLHKAFQIQLMRQDERKEVVDTLFDSATSATSHDYSTSQHPYNINCVYIGEIWRFRLKITNETGYNLISFGLSLNIEVITKGTSTQIYPRPRELSPKKLNRGQAIEIDLEYPVSINTPSTYHLVANISASNDDDTRLYKEFIQFRALPAIDLSYQKQTLDEMLFVEAFVTNVTCEPESDILVNVGFECMGLFKSYNLSFVDENIQSIKMFEKDPAAPRPGGKKAVGHKLFLKPNESKTILFQIEMVDPTSLTNLNALSVGQLQIKWKAGVRGGIFRSDVIQRQSLFCKKLSQVPYDLEILILKCPSSCVVHKPFDVTFQIFNLDTRYSYKIWLSIDKHTSGYVLPINISKKYLGLIESHSNIKTTMTLLALAPGIHLLKGIVIVAKRVDEGHSISGSPRHGYGYHSKHMKQRRRGEEPARTIHYDSLQYIYIDIDDASDLAQSPASGAVRASITSGASGASRASGVSGASGGSSVGSGTLRALSPASVTNLSDLGDDGADLDDMQNDPNDADLGSFAAQDVHDEQKEPDTPNANVSNVAEQEEEEVSVTTGAADEAKVEVTDVAQGMEPKGMKMHKGRKLSMEDNDENEAMLMNEAEHELFALKKMVHDQEEHDKQLIEPPVMHEDDNVNISETEQNDLDPMDQGNDAQDLAQEDNNVMEQDSLVGSTNAAAVVVTASPALGATAATSVTAANVGATVGVEDVGNDGDEAKGGNDDDNVVAEDVVDTDDNTGQTQEQSMPLEDDAIPLNSPPVATETAADNEDNQNT